MNAKNEDNNGDRANKSDEANASANTKESGDSSQLAATTAANSKRSIARRNSGPR